MDKETFLSVIIPSHNESNRIGETLEDISQYLNKQDYSYEIIVCDDGSTDDTLEVAKSKNNVAKNLILSFKKGNGHSGKGDAVQRGILKAKGKYRIFTDADDATPFWQIDKLLKVIKEGNDIAIASRYTKGAKLVPPRGFFRTFVSRGGNIVINFFLGLPYKDTRCGFKLFTAESAEKIFSKILLPSFGFDDEVLVLANKNNFKVQEVPVEWHEKAESKVSFKDVLKSFAETWQIKKNLRKGKYN